MQLKNFSTNVLLVSVYDVHNLRIASHPCPHSMRRICIGDLNHLVVTLGPAVEGVDKIFTDESTLEKVQKQFAKFNVPWCVAKYGAGKLADGGSMTFFSGTLSRAIMANASCLGPVNAAIECLTKCLAKELGPRLRVNCVSPTLTRTSAGTHMYSYMNTLAYTLRNLNLIMIKC